MAFFPAATLMADVVTTSDGSRLVGTVEQIAGGKLVILTEIAGRLEIDASKVTGVSTDQSVNVAVNSGDRLVGPMDSSPDGSSIVRSKLGDISIPPSAITMLWPEGTESPEIAAIREEADAKIEAAKPEWSATLEAGASRTEGNTDTLEGHGRFDLKRKTKDDLLHFYLAGKYGEQDDKRTTNEYFGGIRYENSITERWYWYARTELEFDEFEGIDLRATAAAGAGYYWLKKPEHELKTSLGLGYRHESYDNERTDDDAVLDLGLDYRLDLTPWAQFTHSTVYSPDFLEFDDYRLKFDTALLIPFKDERLAWKLGMRNEYNSRPQSGFDRLDSTYYTSIVLSLRR
jgi:putative salt-induced outer membrane protein YdiY